MGHKDPHMGKKQEHKRLLNAIELVEVSKEEFYKLPPNQRNTIRKKVINLNTAGKPHTDTFTMDDSGKLRRKKAKPGCREITVFRKIVFPDWYVNGYLAKQKEKREKSREFWEKAAKTPINPKHLHSHARGFAEAGFIKPMSA